MKKRNFVSNFIRKNLDIMQYHKQLTRRDNRLDSQIKINKPHQSHIDARYLI